MISLIKNLLFFGWLHAAWNWIKSRCCPESRHEEINDDNDNNEKD